MFEEEKEMQPAEAPQEDKSFESEPEEAPAA